ncbi:MAG: LysR family transcriptional regulator [Polyangiales bacterium]
MNEPRERMQGELHAALAGLDLNLLVTLDALLEARNVTETAERFGVTQSAMSHRLARLREVFDDPLLVSAGDALVLTPRAEELQAPIRLALSGLKDAILPAADFDPREARRTFVLAASDLAEVSLLPSLLRRLRDVSPAISVRMAGRGWVRGDALVGGKIDFAIAPGEGSIPGVGLEETRGIRQRKLVTDGFSVLVRHGHPRVKGTLTLKRYLAEDHVLVAPQGQPGSLVDEVLAKQNHQRRIGAQVASFLSAPFLVAQSDYLLTCPASLADATHEALGLRILKPPLALPRTTLFLYWHERMQQDLGHRWFREELLGLIESRK